jgi:hypothetical protein
MSTTEVRSQDKTRDAARLGRARRAEKHIGAADPNWPDWYAAYMVA